MATDMEATIARLGNSLRGERWYGIPMSDRDAILTVLQAAKAYVDAREAQPAWDADFVLLDDKYAALVRAMKGETL